MKKSLQRVLCLAMSAMMVSSLAIEQNIRLQAEQPTGDSVASTSESQMTITNVTGQYNTSAIREANFNTSVLETEKAVTYEKKTVIVSLDEQSLLAKANGEDVSSFSESWSGEMAKQAIAKQQSAFLSKLSQKGISYTLADTYSAIDNAVAIEINTKYVSTIQEMSGVESVVVSNTYLYPSSSETGVTGLSGASASDITNKTNVYKTGIYDSSAYAATYSGKGMKVAILDTGLDYTHDAYQRFMSEGTWEGMWTESSIEELLKTGDFAAEKTSSAAELYVSAKVPFAYDYADKDADVYPSYSNHGTHVAGIVAGYDENGYTDKDGNHIDETFVGVAPDAQLVICKVFTDDLDSKDIGGAVSEDILAALEDCVLLGVDVINMSLGTTAGFSHTVGDEEGDYMEKVYNSIQTAGISLIAAASNDYSSAYGGAFGTNLVSNPDSATVGSPSTYSSALSVASISGKKSPYVLANKGDVEHEKAVFFEEANDENSNPFDFAKELLGEGRTTGEFTYVVVPNVGRRADYSDAVIKALKGNVALVSRGDTTFQEKVETARAMGAAAIIVYNNVPGVIRMMLGEIEESKRIPAISINMKAGEAMVAAAKAGNGLTGKFTINIDEYAAGPFMSEFSSWGPTPDLKLKPEITAHGGEITSTVPGGYGEQSGTSMASPNMAGFATLVRSYVKQEMSAEVQRVMDVYNVSESVAINRLVNQLTMSTATIAVDQDGLAYSPRKQGAGLASLDHILATDGSRTQAYIYTNNADNDYRPKAELGDTPALGSSYDHNNAKDGDFKQTISFNVRNFGASELSFGMNSIVMTESVASDGLAVAEQACILDDLAPSWKVGGQAVAGDKIVVPANSEVVVEVEISLSAEEIKYIKNSFRNGMYVEGFIQLTHDTQSNLTLPFLSFLGDWTDGTMLDWSAYELAEKEQDTSIPDEEKPQASVYATQPFTAYYNETYVLPMGGYVYLLPEDADPMYAKEEYASVSRYNDYVSSNGVGNYMTSTSIKAVYTGLLRNASRVDYRMYNTETGELILTDTIHRVGKAYSGGGGSRPANVELNIFPNEFGLAQNGQYTMEFDFYLAYGDQDVLKEDNKFEFSFTVDYDAPILEKASVRYQTTKVNNVEKNQIYLDLEIYDNHYPQSVMLCYLDQDKVTGDDILVLATEYIEPVRKPVRNGLSKVSLDITDIYDKYKGELYVQLDDYALNNCVYMLDYEELQSAALPDTFELAEGESEITIAINEAHKVKFRDDVKQVPANFIWNTTSNAFVAVKDGEIVGLRKTPKSGATVSVSNGKGVVKNIKVHVTEEVKPLKLTGISFGLVETHTRALQKAQGVVSVNAGQEFTLEIIPEPWYYPVKDLQINWSTSSDSVVEIDNTGKVRILKEGVASVTASVSGMAVSTSVFFDVQDEFTVSNYTLTDYNGVGYNGEICKGCDEAVMYDELVSAVDDPTNTRNKCPNCKAVVEGGQKLLIIPNDLNVMNIGEEAFKDNDNIEYILMPKKLSQIYQAAFYNCTALKGIYFDSVNETAVDDCELSLMNDLVFYGCINLEFIDLRNVKTFTVGKECFAGCTSLSEIKEMNKIGTMHDYAFQGCTSLTEANLEGLHMSGRSVFSGCTNLTTVTTGKFTAIGESMFANCNKIKTIEIKTPKIGARAFANLSGLESVSFNADGNSELLFDIGDNAFSGCRNLASVSFGDATIRSIGNNAFANTKISSFVIPNGLKTVGSNILSGTKVQSIKLSDSFEFDKLNMLGFAFNGVSIDVEGLSNYQMADGVLYNADGSKLLLVTKDATGEAFTVANSVEEIFAYAFANSKFKKVTFENGGAIEIGEGAFSGASLTEIVFGGRTFNEIKAYTFANSGLTSVTIPASVETISDNAFAGSKISSISFEDNALIHTLGNSVFANCNQLTQVTLPAQIKKMGNQTFARCTELTQVNMPAVESLGSQTFVGASKLKTVVFDSDATTAGTFTFMNNTSVESVTLGASTTKIEDGYYYFFEGYVGTEAANNGYGEYEISQGVFSGCTSLREVIMPGVTSVGLAAFENCRNLTLDVSNLTYVGNRAFYNCNAISSINLSQATYVGDYAFAVENGGASATSVNIPVVETIGKFAFYGNSASEIAIGAATKEIGQAAFASAKNLTKFTVDAQNVVFIAVEDVLYRYFVLSEENGAPIYSVNEYELVAYPSAKVGANKAYTVIDGTLSIKAYAFNGLKNGALSKVELPYSVNTIGDAAFFNSGIKEYTLNSMQAPWLESVFVKSVADEIDDIGGIYKGMYYRNFNDAIADYRDPTLSGYPYNSENYKQTTSKLILNYPVNAKGYDNYVYRQYFGVRNTTEVAMEDYTREAKEMIEALPTAAEISAITTSNTTKEEVIALSDKVMLARTYFNNVKDETQKAFIGTDNAEKLVAVETALKAVKNAFGLTVAVDKITFDSTSYKSSYYVGDAFDPTGMKLTIVYKDGSTETADLSQFTFASREGNPISEYALKSGDKYVVATHTESGKTARITITVQAKPVTPDIDDSSNTSSDSSSDNVSDTQSGSSDSVGGTTEQPETLDAGAIIGICVGAAVVLAAAGGFIFLKVKGLSLKEVFAQNSGKKPEENLEEKEDKENENE